MTQLVLAIVVFLVTHTVPALPRLRGGAIAVFGLRGYLALYSGISVAVLIWVGHAYVQAPYVPVWEYRPVLNWVPVILMPLACILLVGGLLWPNPLSLGLRRDGYDPDRPGILAVVRHPILWALGLWAAAHLVPNGDAASLLLFGLLLFLDVAGAIGLDAKKRRILGRAEWERLTAGTSTWPFGALLTGRARPRFGRKGGVAVAGGLLLYIVLLHLHEMVIGVPPWPPAL